MTTGASCHEFIVFPIFLFSAADNYKQISTIPMQYETHSGEDVPIYSRGPMAHLLTGVKEQNVIAYIMAHAACVGDIGIPCSKGREVVSRETRQNATKSLHEIVSSTENPSNNVSKFTIDKILLLFLLLLHIYVQF